LLAEKCKADKQGRDEAQQSEVESSKFIALVNFTAKQLLQPTRRAAADNACAAAEAGRRASKAMGGKLLWQGHTAQVWPGSFTLLQALGSLQQAAYRNPCTVSKHTRGGIPVEEASAAGRSTFL
jgi:hypothetical protein